MASAPPVPAPTPAARARRQLGLGVKAWFAATALGQVFFALFILLFYYPTTLSGNFAAWNSKPLITGHVAGDGAGNGQFALHVLIAAIATLSGLIQLIPAIRTRWPRLHRWSGRTFLASCFILALGGLWLVWVRGTYLTLAGAVSISLDAALILWFGTMALRTALKRDFASHRRWALRTFIVASGVWMMRVGYIAWAVVTGGAGIGPRMSGPFDLVWGFATYLLPLAVLEMYLRAERAAPTAQRAMAAGLWLCSGIILGGSLGAGALMWWPAISG
jgi:hypothetical protein